MTSSQQRQSTGLVWIRGFANKLLTIAPCNLKLGDPRMLRTRHFEYIIYKIQPALAYRKEHFRVVCRLQLGSTIAILFSTAGTILECVWRRHAAMTLWLLGYPDKALERSQEALALACELSHPCSMVHALYYSAWVHQQRGESRP